MPFVGSKEKRRNSLLIFWRDVLGARIQLENMQSKVIAGSFKYKYLIVIRYKCDEQFIVEDFLVVTRTECSDLSLFVVSLFIGVSGAQAEPHLATSICVSCQ